MKNTILVLILLTFSLSFSQADQDDFESENTGVIKTINDFKTAYNTLNYEAIFDLFNNRLKRSFSINRVSRLYRTIHQNKGDIEDLKFEKIIDNRYSFKAKFKRDILDLVIGIDRNNLINGLIIKRPK